MKIQNTINIITFIEIISSGNPCIADISHNSRLLEKFLIASVNVSTHNLSIYGYIFKNKYIKYTY